MSIALSVNLNKIALIRNSRDGNFPCVEAYAEQAIQIGANGITVHPRPDQRHIRPTDVRSLSQIAKNSEGVEFNIEGNPFAPAKAEYPGLLALVDQTRPNQCTLVPDSDSQKTSDHGFDLKVSADRLKPIIEQLRNWNVRVSLFMDPDPEQIQLAKEVGADRIELYTGPFASAYQRSPDEGEEEFQKHRAAAAVANEIGLGVNAGHDLNLQNMETYKHLPGLLEVSIGHALTVDALNMGFCASVEAYLKVCS